MTSPPRPVRSELADPAGPRVIRLRDPSCLLAALPALLGFAPAESLILIGTGGASGGRIGLTLRVDLPPGGHRRQVCDSVAGTLHATAPTDAVVIVVSGPGRRTPSRAARDVGIAARAALRRRGLAVPTVVWAAQIAGDARWACLDGCCDGVLPDPATTEFAAAAALSGRVLRADRAALEALVAPVEATTSRRRAALLRQVPADEGSSAGQVVPVGETGGCPAIVDAALADAAAGRLVLDDDRVVALAVALRVPAQRDAALVRSGEVDPAAAEQLWAALARETPDPEAAEPAALLAACALLSGDGALVNVALDRVERARPGHRLGRLLRAVAERGIAPSEVRRVLLPSDQA